LLGEGKKDVDVDRLAVVWDNEPDKLEPYCSYNLQDAVLIYKLAQKMFPLIHEFVKLTGLEISAVSRGNFTQFVESVLMKESRYVKELIPNKPTSSERKAHSFTGFLHEADAGIYSNVVAYDFKSLYPSIISTHNISPGTLRCRCCTEIVPGEEMHFCQKVNGFFPKLIGSVIDRRQRILKMLKGDLKPEEKILLSARLESLKILRNSFYSHFGYPYSRWYDLDIAKAVTSYGKYYVQKVVDAAKESGFELLYADTDTIFLKLLGKTKEDAEKFLETLNRSLPEKMQLETEGYYPKCMFISTKTGNRKRYALLTEQGLLKIRGFESVRRNLSTIAKETQEKILYMILKEDKKGEALEYVKKVISDIENKKINLRKTIIYTQLQKEITRYETIAPHVAVAKEMQDKGFNVAQGSIMRYVVSKGEGTIAERSHMYTEDNDYDPEYYVEHQVLPAVDKIFDAADISFNKTIEEKEQSSLSQFI